MDDKEALDDAIFMIGELYFKLRQAESALEKATAKAATFYPDEPKKARTDDE